MTSLPQYTRPPVAETILGVQFEPIAGLANAHLGAFWKTLNGEWKDVADRPPIEPEFERFTPGTSWGKLGFQLKLSQNIATRIQITNSDSNRMIQIQNGRLHINWLGKGGEEYPRYEKVKEEFTSVLNSFEAFLSQEGLESVRPNQWEVTYLNHIDRGTVWEEPSDWSFFLPLCLKDTISDLVPFESFGGTWHYIIPPERGRLHVQFQHGRDDAEDTQEFIRLTLTARGPAVADDQEGTSISEGLDLGRENIVKTFRALMSDSANEYWGLKK